MTSADLTKTSAKPAAVSTARKGVFNVRRVRWLSGVIIAIGFLATMVLCILGIWGQVPRDTVLRGLATLVVVTSATVAFTVFNETVGPKIDG